MKYILALVFCMSLSGAFSQVNISEESDVTRLMERYINYSRSTETVPGWRIQIITTNDRRKMESARSKFASLYPHIHQSWKHVSPYYQVQIGAYRTKLDLQSFLIELKEEFPNAIPVMDKIRKEELLN